MIKKYEQNIIKKTEQNRKAIFIQFLKMKFKEKKITKKKISTGKIIFKFFIYN